METTWKDGKKEGPVKVYNEEGIFTGEARFKNGKFHGPFKMYYSNGKLMSEVNYVDGKKEGMEKDYYDGAGTLESKIIWKNNLKVSREDFDLKGKSTGKQNF
jgi:antitoxin component YwqK of YwqJK toxin-antitoxin module